MVTTREPRMAFVDSNSTNSAGILGANMDDESPVMSVMALTRQMSVQRIQVGQLRDKIGISLHPPVNAWNWNKISKVVCSYVKCLPHLWS